MLFEKLSVSQSKASFCTTELLQVKVSADEVTSMTDGEQLLVWHIF